MIYQGVEYNDSSVTSFVSSVRNSLNSEEIKSPIYRLKTLVDFYRSQKLEEQGIIELVLPSYNIEDINDIVGFVRNTINLYTDKVVLMSYPRDIGLIIIPKLVPVAQAVLVSDNSNSNIATCVHTYNGSGYELGKEYKLLVV